MIKCPGLITPGTVCNDIISNVDFAPTWLEYAGLRTPTYMQGDSFVSSLKGMGNQSEDQVAYHRYWMHADIHHNAYVSAGVTAAIVSISRAHVS